MKSYDLVRAMNIAFNNHPLAFEGPSIQDGIDAWRKLESQCKNILDELHELAEALAAASQPMRKVKHNNQRRIA